MERNRLFVKARVTVPGIHHWPNAPGHFAPLREKHRHQFTFEVEVDVTDPGREVEFIQMAEHIRAFLDRTFERSYWEAYDFKSLSCEQLALCILDNFKGVHRCTVWEDMENCGGAERAA